MNREAPSSSDLLAIVLTQYAPKELLSARDCLG